MKQPALAGIDVLPVVLPSKSQRKSFVISLKTSVMHVSVLRINTCVVMNTVSCNCWRRVLVALSLMTTAMVLSGLTAQSCVF